MNHQSSILPIFQWSISWRDESPRVTSFWNFEEASFIHINMIKILINWRYTWCLIFPSPSLCCHIELTFWHLGHRQKYMFSKFSSPKKCRIWMAQKTGVSTRIVICLFFTGSVRGDMGLFFGWFFFEGCSVGDWVSEELGSKKTWI